MQVRDDVARLLLIKVPRSKVATIRAALALITNVPINDDNYIEAALFIIGEHGSLRTAKLSMISKLRHAYRKQLQVIKDTAAEREKEKIAQSLQYTLQELHAIGF